MDLKPYTDFCNNHVGDAAFICGAGISFLDCLNNSRFAEIHSHVVVSVNSSIIKMPWMDGSEERRYWISNDALCRWWSYWGNLKKAKANRIVRNSWDKYYAEIPDFYKFWPRPTPEDVVNPEDQGLAYCSSVPSALDLCIQMGCKQVFLLGVDQYMVGNNSHFWQLLPKEEQPVRIDRRVATFDEQNRAFSYNDIAFPALAQFAEVKGVKVYNCSTNSKVETFEKIDFVSALDKANNGTSNRI